MSKCFSNFRKSYVAHYQNKHKIQGHTCKICKAQFAEYTELMTVSTSTYPLWGNQVLANFKATLPCFESVPFVFCASCGSDPLLWFPEIGEKFAHCAHISRNNMSKMSKLIYDFRKSYVAHYQRIHKIEGHTCKICKANFAIYTELENVSTCPHRGKQPEPQVNLFLSIETASPKRAQGRPRSVSGLRDHVCGQEEHDAPQEGDALFDRCKSFVT